MRVLAVTPYYAPEGGGLERYAHEILHRLSRRGHTVEALAFGREASGTSDEDGVIVRRFEPALVLGNAPVAPSFPRRVGDRIAELEPDVVVAHTPVPFPAEGAFVASRRADVPFVTTYHAGRLRSSSSLLSALATVHRKTLERFMLANSDRLIAVSPFVREAALARYAEDTSIVPPGVDADRFCPDGPPAGQRILFVGPLSSSYRWKGLDTLWSAFDEVHAREPDAQLTLVGGGDRRAEFRKRARDHDALVRVPGRISDDQLVNEYQNAHVLALPSTSPAESFGMVLAEANACGRPVVGSRVGGIPSFVQEEDNGLLCRPGDADDLAEQLLRVLTDPELAQRMGKRGRQRVLEDHDWEDLAGRTEDVLARAAKSPSLLQRGAP